jgi:hypothetical protein
MPTWRGQGSPAARGFRMVCKPRSFSGGLAEAGDGGEKLCSGISSTYRQPPVDKGDKGHTVLNANAAPVFRGGGCRWRRRGSHPQGSRCQARTPHYAVPVRSRPAPQTRAVFVSHGQPWRSKGRTLFWDSKRPAKQIKPPGGPQGGVDGPPAQEKRGVVPHVLREAFPVVASPADPVRR